MQLLWLVLNGRLSLLVNHFSKKAIEERIESIMKIEKTTLTGIISGLVLIAAVTIVFLTSTTAIADSRLKEAINAKDEQLHVIENELAKAGIVIDTIDSSSNPFIEGMDKGWEAYDIIGKDGSGYLLILRESDNDFTAILDGNNNLIGGMVDSGVLPKYFEAK